MANHTDKPTTQAPEKEPVPETPEQERERIDHKLDEAIEETFPASDPISI